MAMTLALFILYLTTISSEAKDNIITDSSGHGQNSNVQNLEDQSPEEVPLEGFPCSTEKYPFVVTIMVLKKFVPATKGCSGTLIDSLHVLTSASCLSPENTLMVVAGVDNPGGFPEMRHVQYQIPHINYKSETHKTDIAILVLEDPILPSDHISYANLPTKTYDNNEIDTICKKGLSLSWGHTVYEGQVGKLPDVSELTCAQLAIVSSEECKTLSRSANIHEGTICTVSLECQGDKGGPILCNGEQIAVISWKTGCSNHFVEKHSRVDTNMEFIESFVKRTRSMRSRGGSIFTIGITKWFPLIVFIFIKWFYQ